MSKKIELGISLTRVMGYLKDWTRIPVLIPIDRCQFLDLLLSCSCTKADIETNENADDGPVCKRKIRE
jgi:hypothetical protein